MIAEQMRIPDLWLKRALALAVLPEGSRIDWITNQALAECVSGDIATASQLNKFIAGDNHIRVADQLFYLGATLEYLVLNGPAEDFRRRGRECVRQYCAERENRLMLSADALAGTFSDFAKALLALAQSRADFQHKGREYFYTQMAKRLHQELAEALPEDDAQPIKIVPGDGLGMGDRIVREPSREQQPFHPGDTIQFLVPPSKTEQKLFGFELRIDASVITRPWSEAGNWYEPKEQASGKAGYLLDSDAYVVDDIGIFWVQAVGVDGRELDNEDKLPQPMRKLIKGSPADWPRGYAKTMALVTYVRRTLENAEEARSKAKRRGDLDFKAEAPLRLYRGCYSVAKAV